jgi:hypothetical protein
MCVQRFDDSRNSAIHITYRISLRSSSMPEPRDPLLKVLTIFISLRQPIFIRVHRAPRRARARGRMSPGDRVAPVGPPKQQVLETRVGGWAARGPHSVMILPQVHLRKPCYDFYFL